METCGTCVYWLPPKINKRKKKQDRGTCNKITDWGPPEVEIHAPTGCVDCDPYSMAVTELRTDSSFGCILHKARE